MSRASEEFSLSLASGPLPPVTLVLGGARSGKSRHAERIAAHRARRGAFWRTLEEPLALAPVIAGETTTERPLLVDCLTLWLSNLLLAGKSVDAEADMLCGALRL